jgi:uncharacterized protein
MIDRYIYPFVYEHLQQFPAVALLGPRQVGKTTLALQLASNLPIESTYLDLERPSDLVKLNDAEFYLKYHSDKLIIIDEIQRKPDLFPVLRSIIDENRRTGRIGGQFLLLGSSSGELLHKSSESLAGRINYVDMSGLTLLEVGETEVNKLWFRGGFPDSFLAKSDILSLQWRDALIRTYIEREIPALGSKIPAEPLRRFFSMLAYSQADMFNASRLAASLGVSVPTVGRYLDVFTDLFLLRVLRPWFSNYGKRLVKTPKVFLRDCGLLHALLGIHDYESLLSHPIAGSSWEGFVIENLVSCVGSNASLWYYRTSAGAEVDLVIEYQPSKLVAIEIKRSSSPVPSRGFHNSRADLSPQYSYIVYPGKERYKVSDNVEVIGLASLMKELKSFT